jgi:PKD repeat protein
MAPDGAALAAQVTLRWDYTASGASGFVVYCGSASGNYSSRIDVGNTDTYVLSGLAGGSTAYCSVTAYDAARKESGYSNEVSVSVPADAPVAQFSLSPSTGPAPLSVTFRDSSAGTITGWRWDFGDGTTSNAQNPPHVYSTPGSYVAKLTVTGPGGTATKSLAAPISVTAGGSGATGAVVLDNGGAGTKATGSWCVSAAPAAYGANSLYSCGSGPDTYRWTANLTAAGNYDVYVRWTAHPNRSTTVPITVAASGITQTFLKNQQIGGGQWQMLGRFPFAAGTGGYVEVSDRNGQASADAVRWVPAPMGETVLDNGQRGTSSTGAWCVSSATAAYGADSYYSCGSALDTYRWSPSLATAGDYDVYVWWTASSTRSSSVPFTVVSSSGATTVLKDQRGGGGQWQLLGRFTFNAGAGGYVEVSDRNGQACADAVKWVRR